MWDFGRIPNRNMVVWCSNSGKEKIRYGEKENEREVEYGENGRSAVIQELYTVDEN
jgi:hypothetical protein